MIARVCDARPQASFFVQVEDVTRGEALSVAIRASGAAVRATIQPEPLPTAGYFRQFLLSDLVLQPYSSPAYALMPSGVFADAVVCGTPVVTPASTWMSDRLDEGWGAGVTFPTPSAEQIVAATLTAIDRVADLRTQAFGQGQAWRKANSLEAYVDHIMARLDIGAA